MKKLLSLLLVGVVAVSMFGFIRPNRVNAAEVNNDKIFERVDIKSYLRYTKNIYCEISNNGKGINKLKFSPKQPGRFSSRFEFYIYSVNTLKLDIGVVNPNNPNATLIIMVELHKWENSSSNKKLDALSITIDKNAKLRVNNFNNWIISSLMYEEQ